MNERNVRNDPFSLRQDIPILRRINISGAGGGLGYKWCLDHTLWFYQNPDVLTVEIVDKFTGERFTSYIPAYFRRKLYPCPSMLVRKEIRDTIQLVDYFLSLRARIVTGKQIGRAHV